VADRRTVIFGSLGVAMAALAGYGIIASESDDPDDGVQPAQRSTIDELERQGDCGSLQERFDDADETAFLEYIDAAMRRAGCYD
jgi:hypothetical protein